MHVIFAKPRGFCAGVDRAIAIIEHALARFGLPLYVKHAIVHNRHEVERIRKLGVIFVEEMSEIPPGSRVILSAHGSPPQSFIEAKARNLEVIDAVEGEERRYDCVLRDAPCGQDGRCELHDFFADAREALAILSKEPAPTRRIPKGEER